MTASVLMGALGVLMSAPASAACTANGKHDPASLRYICDGARGWAESVASGDTAVLARILAEDFIGIDPKGKQYRKAAMLKDTKEAPKHFKSNQINDVIVRFYGPVAVAQGSETWERVNGTRGQFVWTDTWLRRNGRWQIIAAQDVIASVEPGK
jgi:ketosteroid isomerase-like protein